MLKPILAFLLFLACACTWGNDARAVEQKAPESLPGDDLRARLGAAIPRASSMVVVHGVAQHHLRKEWSIAAWRGDDGTWTIQRTGERTSGLLRIERLQFPLRTDKLTSAEASTLEGLINDRAVFEEPVQGGEFEIGVINSTMEIVGPAGRRRIAWTGKLTGKLGQIADLVIGPY